MDIKDSKINVKSDILAIDDRGTKLSDIIIELPQVKFNPDDFLKLYDKDYKFQIYTSSHGNVSPQEVSYDKRLLEEPIVKHYLNVFKDLSLIHI